VQDTLPGETSLKPYGARNAICEALKGGKTLDEEDIHDGVFDL